MSEQSSEDAERELLRLLELPPDPTKPPLSDLFAELSPVSAQRVAPRVVEAVRRGRLPFEGEETHRLMSQISERLWSNGYLCLRARSELSTRVLQAVLREIERRLSDSPREEERKRLEKGLAHGRARALAQESPDAIERRAHPIWRSARAAVRSGPIRETPHLAGPMPELDRGSHLLLARWAFDRVRESFVADAAVQHVIDLVARRDYDAMRDLRQHRPEPMTEMFELAERVATLEMMLFGRPQPRLVRQIVRGAALMLREIGDGEAFVDGLDREMMRLEVIAQLERAKRPVPDPFEVLARGEDERGKPAAWLLRTQPHHLFFARVGKSWIHEQGEPDEVIASVPDRWFDLVANAMR